MIRRRLFLAVAAILPFLVGRRSVAKPAPLETGIPATVPLPVPVASPSPVAIGWWRGPAGWAYHPDLGWMHSFMPMRDLTPPNWYGPPPPLPARIPMDWGKILNGKVDKPTI